MGIELRKVPPKDELSFEPGWGLWDVWLVDHPSPCCIFFDISGIITWCIRLLATCKRLLEQFAPDILVLFFVGNQSPFKAFSALHGIKSDCVWCWSFLGWSGRSRRGLRERLGRCGCCRRGLRHLGEDGGTIEEPHRPANRGERERTGNTNKSFFH